MSFSDSDIELELPEPLIIKNEIIQVRHTPYKMNTQNVSTNPSAPTAAGAPIMFFQISELNALTNSLPEFYPGSNLSTFITAVDNLAEFLQGKLTPTQTYLFNISILAKTKNEARDYLNFQRETEWPGIRNALLRKYGDQRNEELLISALRNTIQKRNENYNDYYDRILLCQNDLLQYVQLHERDPNIFAFKKSFYQNQALQIFCSGLNEPYRSHLMHFDISSLDEALNKCRVFDNKLQENSYVDYLRKIKESDKRSNQVNTNHSLTNKFSQSPTLHKQRLDTFTTNNQNFRTFQPQNPFQQKSFTGPINKPIPPRPQSYLTNKHVFGTKPPSMVHKQYKPTPMSVQ